MLVSWIIFYHTHPTFLYNHSFPAQTYLIAPVNPSLFFRSHPTYP